MNVSSQSLLVLPTNHHRHLLTTTHSPMFVNASPIAVSNKIKAIQARKTRLTLLPTTDSHYTDIRPLNFGYGTNYTNSRTNFSLLTTKRLTDRRKDIRLDRISTRQPPRPSVLSNTSTNQQSLLWPNYQLSTGYNKQHPTQSISTTITPPVIESSKYISLAGKVSDIPRQRNQSLLIDRQNSLTPIEPQQKSLLKSKPLEIPIHNHLPSSDNEENFFMDEEFEEYLGKAITKCADWLNKYVFNQQNN